MKINIAKSAGFCFGVKRAINIALESAKTQDKVYILGDIVHNEDVVNQMNKLGIKKIARLRKGKNQNLLIRAHGAPAKVYMKALKLGYKIIDATCPMVKEIHKIAMGMERKGYKIIIIGDKRHDEVMGIIGQLKTKPTVINKSKGIAGKRLKRAAIVIQSTQNLEKSQKIVEAIKGRAKELKIFNTICKPTRIKQKEIQSLPLKNDVMIIIGSKISANTRRLYEISKSLNSRSYWVQSKRQIKADWFQNARDVGISAGASTPDSTTKEIIQYIKEITK